MKKLLIILGICFSACGTTKNIHESDPISETLGIMNNKTVSDDKNYNEVEQAFFNADFEIPKQTIQALDFTLFLSEGGIATLSDFRGKVLIIIFWASHCQYCREELSLSEVLYHQFKNKELEILAINNGEDGNVVRRFINENNYTFPVLLDSDGSVSVGYGIRGIPTIFVLDREGKIIAVHTGRILANQNVLTALNTLFH